MAHPRKFRFGVQLSSATSRKDWINKVRRAADLGYTSVFMPDHFGEQLAPIPALVAAAEVADVRVGTLVADNDYKHPVVLAKEMATIDLLTEGRLELGIGAGWMKSDYEGSGIPYDPPSVRIDRFEEGVAILKGLLSEGAFSFSGRHYTITNMDGRPNPVQKPHPPILIGGGAPRVLGIAGREADIVGINVNLRAGEIRPEMGADATSKSIEQKVQWVRDGAGDRFDDIELNVLVFMGVVTDDRMGQAAMLAGMFGLTPEQALEVPLAVCGTVDQICEDFVKRRELYGISYPVITEAAFESLGPVVERLAGT